MFSSAKSRAKRFLHCEIAIYMPPSRLAWTWNKCNFKTGKGHIKIYICMYSRLHKENRNRWNKLRCEDSGTFCFCSFFFDSFFLSGSSARAKACSFSTRVIWKSYYQRLAWQNIYNFIIDKNKSGVRNLKVWRYELGVGLTSMWQGEDM